MKQQKFSLTHQDIEMIDLVNKTDKKTLAVWAIDCAQRVMPYFEKQYPNDKRPQKAIKTLQEWIKTDIFSMTVIRRTSLDAHAAAREAGEDNPARSVARAAGQTVATAHVPRHAYGSAIYAQQAVWRASEQSNAEQAANKERDWQYNHLQNLNKSVL